MTSPGIVAHLHTFGDRMAVIGDDGRELTYAQLAALVEQFAKGLAAERISTLGTGGESGATEPSPVRRLAVLAARNDIGSLIAYLGALEAGCAVLLTGSVSDELLRTYDPDIVLKARDDAEVPEPRLRRAGSAHELHPELALLLSTSGSTGSPKLVRLSYRNLLANAESIAEYLEIDDTERAATTLPFFYCYGLSVIHSHLLRGASLLLTGRSVLEPEFWDAFRCHRATSFAAVPYTFDLLERVGFEQMSLPNLRYITQAGGKLAPDRVRHHARLADNAGRRFYVMYGQTEATARMAYLPPHLAAEHPECIGIPVPGGSFTLEPVEEGGDELVYHGPNVMMGYAESPADLSLGPTRTALRTGDLACRTEDGLYRVIGRRSRFAKIFGLRIDLQRIESGLAAAGYTAHCTDDAETLVIAVQKDAPRTTLPEDSSPGVDHGQNHAGMTTEHHHATTTTERGHAAMTAGRSSYWRMPAHSASAGTMRVTGSRTRTNRAGLPRPLETHTPAVTHDAEARSSGHAPTDAAEVARTAARLAGLPESAVRVCPVREIPRLPSGKPDYPAIRRLRGATVESPTGIRELFASALGLPVGAVDPGRSFADLGGDSLTYVALSVRLDHALGQLPSNWQTMTVAELEALPRRRRRFGRSLDTSTLLRALGIIAVVGSHIGLFVLWGGAHVLLAVAGFNFARFGVTAAPAPQRMRNTLRTVGLIAAPTAAWVLGTLVFSDYYGWQNVLLLNKILGPHDSPTAGHLWFIEVAVYFMLAGALLLRIPFADMLERRAPFWFALGLLGAALIFRYRSFDLYTAHDVPFSPLTVWFFLLGWAAAKATTTGQRAVLSAVALLTVPGYFGETDRERMILAGLLLLIWLPSVRVPALLAGMAALLADASLFAYLLHWQVYPLFGEHRVLALVASLAAGVTAARLMALTRGAVTARDKNELRGLRPLFRRSVLDGPDLGRRLVRQFRDQDISRNRLAGKVIE
ncbi:AMP-binding protein [Nocardia huaxiensis]|uniref:AMP-binding protein n=1 Tax=Nocardia huaxiensis TaxID=2755382 RepID=UPI001E4E6798|nr:AMP-binding protein [Nocardia huaxiensis]UFS98771.1 AMP-binding protein [Nocardia huaxiensis]